ncbi:MAG: peptidoglycan-binding protein [Parasporobacterium sp.]|nr:peptidoglycan-binding protein [Parasporobacterium sp.]
MKRKLLIFFITAVLTIAMCGTAFGAGGSLYNGSSGDDVYELQRLLMAYGYFYDEPTGYFGDITEQALIEFQYDHGLTADGVAGPETGSYLGLVIYDSDDDYEDSSYSYDESSFTRTLYNGLEGSDVYTLQVLLSDYGYFYSAPTGFFGDLTEEALIDFQRDYGLDADGLAGSATIGLLTGSSSGFSTGSSYSFDYASAVLDAVYRTPSTGAGYCAAWVTNVMENAGILTYNINNLKPSYYSYATESGLTSSISSGFNANDYWAYVCYSSDINDLQPGMVVATRSSYTYLGRQYGHVGIYLGDGQVISSIGYLETLSLDEWERRYNNTDMGSTIAWGYVPY